MKTPTTTDIGDYEGKIAYPVESHIDLSDETINLYNKENIETLFRYVSGNPRWEVGEERGLRYAFGMKTIDHNIIPNMNGFYSTHDNNQIRQTRILLAFGTPYGFGTDRGNITRVTPGSNNVPLIVESTHSGSPGYSSYVIIGSGGLFLEIFEQTPELKRTFTQEAYNEVSAELLDVLKYKDAINSTGILPIDNRYPKPLPSGKAFNIDDGIQPGIYLVSAAINPTSSGYAFIRAFNSRSGDPLSIDELTRTSKRFVGWSQDGKTFFYYQSEITIYEGDWSSKYEARFEIWYHSDLGIERKFAETTRLINGWQR